MGELKKPVLNLVQSIIKTSKNANKKPSRVLSTNSKSKKMNQNKRHSFSVNENSNQRANQSVMNDSMEKMSRVNRILSRKRSILS